MLVSTTDMVIRDERWDNTDGSITVAATGGFTSTYFFRLLPDGTQQLDGNFTILADDYDHLTADSTIYFTIELDDFNNCGPVYLDSIALTGIVGFETKSGIEVNVYPNPTSGNVTIELPYAEPEAELEVLNMTGQIVLQRKVYSSGGIINETLDLSDQATGLYMIRINGEALQSAIMVK